MNALRDYTSSSSGGSAKGKAKIIELRKHISLEQLELFDAVIVRRFSEEMQWTHAQVLVLKTSLNAQERDRKFARTEGIAFIPLTLYTSIRFVSFV